MPTMQRETHPETTEALIDYAQHLIRLDALARECHDYCLDKRYAQAAETALQIRAEARLLELTLREMAELEGHAQERYDRIRTHT